MNNEDEETDALVEELLRQVSLAQTPARLDGRVEKLLAPRRWRWRWAGPVIGFAAGSMATACVMLGVSRPGQRPAPGAGAGSGPQVVKEAAGEKTVVVWAQPQRMVQEVEGNIGGVPVRMEQVSYQYQLRQAGKPVAGVPEEIVVPGPVTVRPVVQY